MTIIASTVNYLTGQVISPGRDRLLIHEQADGIAIWRTWTYAGLHRSYVTRVLSFFSFMLSSFAASLRIRKVDLVWGTSPPIFQAVTAYLVARLKRVPFLLEIRDLWPDFAIEAGVLRSQVLIRGSRWLEHVLYREADRLIVNSPGFLPHLHQRGVPHEKADVVANGVDVNMFNPNDQGKEIREEFGLEDKFIALYTGAHGLANDLETVLLAAKRLKPYSDIMFVFVGDGKERTKLVRQAEQSALSNVRFIRAQPKKRIPAFLAAADICIAILKAIPAFTSTYPNKVFDYMAAGRATVLAIDGVIRHVIETANAGLFVLPGNPESLAMAVLKYRSDSDLRREHGENARRYVTRHFNRNNQAWKIQSIFEELVRNKSISSSQRTRSKIE